MPTPLPNPDEAFATLFDKVHAEVFFQKLASFGVYPQSREDSLAYLDLAGKLRRVEEEPAVKQANQSLVIEANGELDVALQKMGLDTGAKQAAYQEEELAIRQLAHQIAVNNPDVYRSVVSLKLASENQWTEHPGAQTAA